MVGLGQLAVQHRERLLQRPARHVVREIGLERAGADGAEGLVVAAGEFLPAGQGKCVEDPEHLGVAGPTADEGAGELGVLVVGVTRVQQRGGQHQVVAAELIAQVRRQVHAVPGGEALGEQLAGGRTVPAERLDGLLHVVHPVERVPHLVGVQVGRVGRGFGRRQSCRRRLAVHPRRRRHRRDSGSAPGRHARRDRGCFPLRRPVRRADRQSGQRTRRRHEALLHGVSDLVREESHSGPAARVVLAGAEHDVPADREGARVQRLGRGGGVGVRVEPDPAEVGGEPRLKDPASAGRQFSSAGRGLDGARTGRESPGDLVVGERTAPGDRGSARRGREVEALFADLLGPRVVAGRRGAAPSRAHRASII